MLNWKGTSCRKLLGLRVINAGSNRVRPALLREFCRVGKFRLDDKPPGSL
jgi:hypothetical protein